MRWAPELGHVPRGMCGATGDIQQVELVIVTAEPGDPLPGETHSENNFEDTIAHSETNLRNSATPFHSNICWIMKQCFPSLTFDEQLKKVWRTNAVLCSAEIEGGKVPREVEDTCVAAYLRRQLDLVPKAMVAALGKKAQQRLRRHGIQFVEGLHPSCRNSRREKESSWQRIAEALQSHNQLRRNSGN